jgi:hypothetical protein
MEWMSNWQAVKEFQDVPVCAILGEIIYVRTKTILDEVPFANPAREQERAREVAVEGFVLQQLWSGAVRLLMRHLRGACGPQAIANDI